MPFPFMPVAMGLGTLVGGFTAHKQRQENRAAWNRSVAHEQAIWERDTAYNSPQAQMQRFKEAGLNPNLMYGQGNPGNAQGKPLQSESYMSGVQMPGFSDVIGPIYQAVSMGKDIELKDAQIRRIEEETALLGIKFGTEQQRFQLSQQQMQFLAQQQPELLRQLRNTNQFFEDTYQSQVDARNLQVENLANEAQLKLKRLNLLDEDYKIKKEVLTSKQFSNAILQVQKEFMEGGDITPDRWIRILTALLLKIM